MPDRPARTRTRSRAVRAATAVLCLLGVLPALAAGSAAAAPAASRPSITLSVQPGQVALRQCMTEVLRLAITNQSAQSVFVDVTITPETPLWSANTRISTYAPAGGVVTVPVQLYVPEDTADGAYDVGFDVERTTPTVVHRPDLTVPVTVSAPPDRRCVPRSEMTVTASSAQEPENTPAKAIDGRTATIWHARFRPDRTFLPQWITFDLGGSYDVAELSYQPRLDGNLNGTVTAYTVLASADGQAFTEVASGTWAGDTTRKAAVFDASGARHIRLLATGGVADYAGAAEIVLFGHAGTQPPG